MVENVSASLPRWFTLDPAIPTAFVIVSVTLLIISCTLLYTYLAGESAAAGVGLHRVRAVGFLSVPAAILTALIVWSVLSFMSAPDASALTDQARAQLLQRPDVEQAEFVDDPLSVAAGLVRGDPVEVNVGWAEGGAATCWGTAGDDGILELACGQ